MLPNSRKMMDVLLASTNDPRLGEPRAGGAFADDSFLTWRELCPKDMEAKLFRDP